MQVGFLCGHIFIAHISAHQRVTTHSVDIREPLSPARPVITQWAHEQSSHNDRNGGYLGCPKIYARSHFARKHMFVMKNSKFFIDS